jgi:hypothetical protein
LFFEGNLIWELLLIEDLLMLQQGMFDIAVALVAPEAKVGEAENDWMVVVIGSMCLYHVRLHVA